MVIYLFIYICKSEGCFLLRFGERFLIFKKGCVVVWSSDGCKCYFGEFWVVIGDSCDECWDENFLKFSCFWYFLFVFFF